jgi:D-inositol-3-phosphate glycosyltransferase
MAWERAGVDAASRWPWAWVADVGRFLTRHLRDAYGLPAARLVPFPAAVALDDPWLRPMGEGEARRVAWRWEIPLDRPLILTVGRTDPTKGIDVLLDAVGPLRDGVHVVVIAVPMPGWEHLLAQYRERIAAGRLRATVVAEFSRELPRALCAVPGTMVACPSRGETLANVPFEVALWGEDAGAVVVAPDRDGFAEQIEDGTTGVLYDPARPDALTAALRGALALDAGRRGAMARAAAARVRRERDAIASLRALVSAVWRSPSV